jgi:hypothetical protein
VRTRHPTKGPPNAICCASTSKSSLTVPTDRIVCPAISTVCGQASCSSAQTSTNDKSKPTRTSLPLGVGPGAPDRNRRHRPCPKVKPRPNRPTRHGLGTKCADRCGGPWGTQSSDCLRGRLP